MAGGSLDQRILYLEEQRMGEEHARRETTGYAQKEAEAVQNEEQRRHEEAV
jgi:hypothetical protein